MKGNEEIVIDYVLPDAPARVWQALTDPELLARWLMKNDIKPVVGHRFQFRAQPQGDWNGIVDCEVLEIVPGQRIAYSWNGGKVEGEGYKLETTVTWTLGPRADGGTDLKLVHHGFRPEDYALQAMGSGWRSMGAGISQAIAAEA